MNTVFNTKIDKGLWADFVLRHPLGNVFQSPEFFDVFSSTKNNQPLAIAVCEEGSIIGLLLANIVYNGTVLTRSFTARSLIIGGPLAKDNDPTVINTLIDEYLNCLPKFVVYSEVRPVYNMASIAPVLIDRGFIRTGHYNLSLDISAEENAIWDGMHKERRRNVRKAQTAGLVFRLVDDDASIKEVVSLIRQTYERKRVPLASSDLFTKAREVLKDHIRFFAAYLNDRMVAGQIRLYYRELAYAWYAGSDESYFKLYPNDFLMWNVICWSRQNGYGVFDFGGGGEPGVPYGVRDYKLKYGCRIEDLGRYVYYHKPSVYKLARWGMRILGMKKG